MKAVDRLEQLGLVDHFMPAQRTVAILAVECVLAEAEGRAPVVRADLVPLIKSLREQFMRE